MVDRQTKMVSPSSSTAYLPLEIICIIIKQTDDVQTLENWCSATRRCRALRTFTLKTRWANVIISQDNLISKFDDLPSPTWGNDLIQRAITNENATEPLASLIKSLTLWFQFRAPPKVPTPTIFSYDRTCDNWDPKWLPSSEDIQHSLSTLLPHCTSLKQLDHDGVLYQENLDEICKLTTIECVRLRTTYPNFPARWRHPPYHCGPMRNGLDGARMGVHFEFRTLPFENLGRLQNLVQLEIGEIWEDEGRGIAQAVGQLRNLKVLSLTAGHKTASDGIWPSSPTQLRLLFVFLFSVTSEGEEGICKLPATLESLVISDPQSSCVPIQGDRACIPARDANSPKHTLPKLRDLYLNLESEDDIKYFLDWLDLPDLRRLTLPRIITLHGYRAYDDPDPDPRASEMARVINSAIRIHQHTLEQVVLLNAWQHGYLCKGDLNGLDDDWADGFTSQEMIFATQPPHPVLPEAIEEQEDAPTVMREYCKLYRKAIRYNQSRSTLRRLRIDQIDFCEDLIADLFDRLHLKGLRILMLYPWKDLDQQHDGETHTTPTAHTYKDLSTFVEGQVALRIALLDFPQLRILVIGGHRFWIEQTERTSPRLWALSEALTDPHQRSKISENILQMDWRFLQDLPSHPSTQDPHARRRSQAPDSNCCFTSWPSLQMVKQRNYTVLLRENGPEDLAPHHPSIRRLMNLPSWDSFLGERLNSHCTRRGRPSGLEELYIGNFLYFDEVKVEQVFS